MAFWAISRAERIGTPLSIRIANVRVISTRVASFIKGPKIGTDKEIVASICLPIQVSFHFKKAKANPTDPKKSNNQKLRKKLDAAIKIWVGSGKETPNSLYIEVNLGTTTVMTIIVTIAIPVITITG